MLNMKQILFLFFALFVGNSGYSQKQSLSINFMANLSPGFSIFNYSKHDLSDVSVSSDPSMGYEAGVSYTRPLSEKIAIEIGLIGGIQSYSFTLFFKESFIDYQSFQQDFFLEKITGYDLEYYGFNLGLRYKLLARNKSSTGLLIGANAVYYSQQDHALTYGAFLSNYQSKDFFYAHSDINPKNTIFLAPNFGIWYNYQLNKRMILGIKLNGVVSNHIIMENYFQEPEFLIFGDNETVKGSWEKKYRQFGLGLSFSYLLNNN